MPYRFGSSFLLPVTFQSRKLIAGGQQKANLDFLFSFQHRLQINRWMRCRHKHRLSLPIVHHPKPLHPEVLILILIFQIHN